MSSSFDAAADGDSAAPEREGEWARRLLADAPAALGSWREGPGQSLCAAAQAVVERSGTKLSPSNFICDIARICAKRYLLAAGDSQPARLLDFAPTHLAELCLARACAARPPDEAAWEQFLESFRARLLSLASSLRVGDPEAQTDEFLADLWAPRRHGLSVLDTYEGRAPLGAWLALVFRRRVLRLRARAVGAPLALDNQRACELVADPVARAELLQLLRGELLRELGLLSSRDRDLVEARVLRSERGQCTAARYGVSASYVSRRYSEVLQILQRRMRPVLERLGADLESL